ncbi:DUF3151 family protein [Streptomyces sp. NPDC048278]|uniref:DUF3151 family protein n=1 Tax=Streptomyces sp. NPDC048278 TaxID=3155809 RepID=UPI003441B373
MIGNLANYPVNLDTGRRLRAEEPPGIAALAGPDPMPGQRPEPVSEDTARRAVEALFLQHQDAVVRPWERLGRYAAERGDMVTAYAYFAAALLAADRVLDAMGYQPGDRLSWDHPANRPVIQASCGLGLAAKALGRKQEADQLRHRTQLLAADSPR